MLHAPGDDAATPYALLAHAARTKQAWLRLLVSHLVTPDANHLDEPAVELLARAAADRHRWNMTGPTPLGPASTTEDQSRESADLLDAIHTAIGQHDDRTERSDLGNPEPRQGLGI